MTEEQSIDKKLLNLYILAEAASTQQDWEGVQDEACELLKELDDDEMYRLVLDLETEVDAHVRSFDLLDETYNDVEKVLHELAEKIVKEIENERGK